MRNIINVLNWKDNENVKDKNKENVITIIIENDIKNKNENINIKNIINDNEKWLITIIGNQIGNVNDKMNREC